MTEPKLIRLTEADLTKAWAIEQQAHAYPWAKTTIDNLNSRGGAHFGLFMDDQLIGYYYSQNIVGEVSLLNIAIDPSWQGKGLGKRLLELMIDKCKQDKADSIWLEVRESNKIAYSLYESIGFNEVDRRKGYYPKMVDGRSDKEDAIVMSYFIF